MAKINIPIVTFKEIDFDFNKIWEDLISTNSIYNDDGTRAFNTKKQLIAFLKDDFVMNIYDYLTYIFNISEIVGTNVEHKILERLGVYHTLLVEYSEFLDKKFKGVSIDEIYEAHPYGTHKNNSWCEFCKYLSETESPDWRKCTCLKFNQMVLRTDKCCDNYMPKYIENED